jgi:hypothetical protein
MEEKTICIGTNYGEYISFPARYAEVLGHVQFWKSRDGGKTFIKNDEPSYGEVFIRESKAFSEEGVIEALKKEVDSQRQSHLYWYKEHNELKNKLKESEQKQI